MIFVANIVIDVPLSLAQLLVIVFFVVPTICVVATLESHRFATRHHRTWVKEEKAKIAKEKVLLIEEAANLKHERNDLRIERDAVTEARREFREAADRLHDEEEHFDTMISVLDMDEIPHPNDTADTVEFPAVREDLQ